MFFGGSEERRSKYNRQLQPWGFKGSSAYMDTTIPLPESSRLGEYYQPYRPLTSRYGANALVDPRSAYGMYTEPIKFSNLVTEFQRNPAQAARSALYTRFTPVEWNQNNLEKYIEADALRNYSERLRGDSYRTVRETDEKTSVDQRESGRRLGERITDISFWRNECATELEKLLAENSELVNMKHNVEKAILDIEGPLHIGQECLYHRENRDHTEMVHDMVEQSLLREIETYRNCQDKLKAIAERIKEQIRNNRAAQFELETNVQSKESALGIDQMCHQLNNYSKGINYYAGIEKYEQNTTDPTTWAEHSNRIVQRSQSERAKTVQLRTESDNLINHVSSLIWEVWTNTNNALARRTAEILDAKGKLQMHLQKTQQEIFDLERHIEMLRKALHDKTNPIKVAHTRLEARSHRKGVELCKDTAHERLVSEVYGIQDSIETLHRKLEEAENQHQKLLRTQSKLETELHNKTNSLFIDREKCSGMRRSFPITATVKY